MTMQLSTEAWVSLICIIVLILAINLPLLMVILGRKQLRLPFFHTGSLSKMAKTVRQPWHEEESQMQELADKVKNLPESKK